MLSMASNWAPHLLGCCELSLLHLLFFMDAISKGVRLVFCVGTSCRPCKPGRMYPCKSMSVLASDPNSWAEVTWTESTGQICLFSALSKCFQVISESCLVSLFVLFLMQDLENSNYLLRSNIGEKFWVSSFILRLKVPGVHCRPVWRSSELFKTQKSLMNEISSDPTNRECHKSISLLFSLIHLLLS